MPCHFWMQFLQQVAVACCATNAGCPLMGVCFPSFFGYRGAIRVEMKSTVWARMVLKPFSRMYARSFSDSLNLALKSDFRSNSNSLAIPVFILRNPPRIFSWLKTVPSRRRNHFKNTFTPLLCQRNSCVAHARSFCFMCFAA